MAQEHDPAMSEIQQALQSVADMSQQQNGQKRKQSDNNPQQQRTKRNRYISIACNECKRRKIKCNGETPCHRCGNLNLDCIYAPNCCSSNFKESHEFKQMNEQILALQNEVNSLFHNINSLRSALGHELPSHEVVPYGYDSARSLSAPQAPMVDPALTRPQKQSPNQPQYHGSTSSAFNLNLARSSLQSMGITSAEEGMDEAAIQAREATPESPAAHRMHPGKDPIWGLNRDEAVRLCRVYDDEMGTMYPILDIEKVINHATLLFRFIDATNRTGFLIKEMPGPDSLDDEETSLLKLVLANALVAEAGGQSELGRGLFENVVANNEARLRGNADLRTIRILTLTAMYHFHTDNEGLSWRVIGTAARLCLELGLNRAETYTNTFKNENDRAAAIKLFWSVYNLDRRWSFGTGMSFALRESDLDANLPKPNEGHPYLTAMIEYCKLGSRVWESVVSISDDHSFTEAAREKADFLDFQLSQWTNSLPTSLRFIHPESGEFAQYARQHGGDGNGINNTGGRALHRQRVTLHLRTCQMRILIYRPVLYSASSILASSTRDSAQKVVDTAKDTVQILSHINNTTDLYQTQPMCFNHFLISAMAVLLLAVSHAPAQFADKCRDEFYMALDLVRGLSINSHVGRRLWHTVRGLKEIGPKLGLRPSNNERPNSSSTDHSKTPKRHLNQPVQHDAHSSAAMAMAGLAGHPVDETTFYSSYRNQEASPNSSLFSFNAMANDLTSLFEAAGGFANMNIDGASSNMQDNDTNFTTASMSDAQGDAAAALRAMGQNVGPAIAYGNEEELNRVVRDMF